MEVQVGKDERIEDLQYKGLKIIQNANLYTFTSDSVILANFVKLKKSETALEIGVGCGVISILLSQKQNYKKIVGFELQKKLFDIANKNIKLNNIENINFINDRVQNFSNYFNNYSFDVVFCNPPYKKDGSSEPNLNESKALARHEKTLPLKDLIEYVEKALKYGGRFYVIYDADRSCELIYEMIKHNIEPKRLFFTQNGKGKSILVVIEGIKYGKHGVKILPPVVTNDRDGKYIHDLNIKRDEN